MGRFFACQNSKRPIPKAGCEKDVRIVVSPTGLPEKRGYDVMLRMVQHTDDLSFEETMRRLVTAIFLVNCMECVGYLPPDTTLLERVFFARLAFDIYNIFLSNNHSVSFLADAKNTNAELKRQV